jgi:hypothetical protein
VSIERIALPIFCECIAEKLEVQIKVLNESDDFNEIFNCNDYSNFDNTDKNVEQLTQKIAQTLSGESDFLSCHILHTKCQSNE